MTAERRMKVGVVLPIAEEDGRQPGYAEIRDIARVTERAGLDSVWVFDHLLYRDGQETSGIHEAWTILAAIAEATSGVELGTIVMATSFRNPALQAKMAATLDEVSGGRLILAARLRMARPRVRGVRLPDRSSRGPLRRVAGDHHGPDPDGPGRP